MIGRIGRDRPPARWAAAAAAGLALWALPSFAQTSATQPLRVTLNHAQAVTLEAAAATALVADPDVADIVNERGNLLFVLGRKLGSTNLLVYDGSGRRLVDREVIVVPDNNGVVTVTRDLFPSDYYCDPRCVPAVLPAPPSATAAAAGPPGAAPSGGGGAAPASGAPVSPGGPPPVPQNPGSPGVP